MYIPLGFIHNESLDPTGDMKIPIAKVFHDLRLETTISIKRRSMVTKKTSDFQCTLQDVSTRTCTHHLPFLTCVGRLFPTVDSVLDMCSDEGELRLDHKVKVQV